MRDDLKPICDLCNAELDLTQAEEDGDWHECVSLDEFMEQCPDYALANANLMRFSTHYKWKDSPEAVYLKLIRHPMGDNIEIARDSGLGYYELDLIGLALCEYATRPLDVIEWVEKAHRIESRNG